MKLFLRLKQKFCKHEMKHIANETRKTQLTINSNLITNDIYEIHECSKCGKRMTIRIPKFTTPFKTKYDFYFK